MTGSRAFKVVLVVLATVVATSMGARVAYSAGPGQDGLVASAGPSLAEPAATSGAAQHSDASATDPLRSGYVEVEKVRLVLVPVIVEDKHGRAVQGLAAKDFRLLEDYIPQKIQYFSVESGDPVSIAFMLDVSGSMRMTGKLDAAKEAIRYFLDAMRPQDKFALICFADQQVSWITEFTSDRERFLKRLWVQRGYGQTALNDAVGAAPALVESSTEGKKAIVLITDGVDNASRLTIGQAVELARRASVPIYTIGFSSLRAGLVPRKEEIDTNFEVLKRFSDDTGGEIFAVHDPDELKDAAVRIEEELAQQYVIGYTPSRTFWNGAFRRIQLTTRKSSLVVRARTGYYATP